MFIFASKDASASSFFVCLSMGGFLCLLVLPVTQLTLEEPVCQYQQRFGDIEFRWSQRYAKISRFCHSPDAVSTKKSWYPHFFQYVSAHLIASEVHTDTWTCMRRGRTFLSSSLSCPVCLVLSFWILFCWLNHYLFFWFA